MHTAAAAAIAQATKAAGAIVRMDPNDFQQIIYKTESPLVVAATSKLFKTNYDYLTSYKGLVFYTRSPRPLQFGSKVELVNAKKIWIPA